MQKMAQLKKDQQSDFPDKLSLDGVSGGRVALSGWPMVIFAILMVIFACHASTHMVAQAIRGLLWHAAVILFIMALTLSNRSVPIRTKPAQLMRISKHGPNGLQIILALKLFATGIRPAG